jgi:hypothetical protein
MVTSGWTTCFSGQTADSPKIVFVVSSDDTFLQEHSGQASAQKSYGWHSRHGCRCSCRDWCVGRGWVWYSASTGCVARASWVVASCTTLRLAVNILRAGGCRAHGCCGAAVTLRLAVDILGADWYWCSTAALRLPVDVLGAHNWDHAALRLAIDILATLHRHRGVRCHGGAHRSGAHWC